mmetsp:Transcript_20455/g.36375  ORF Transcript_20455/g.36375 Transcript_20455/m.36375 type:complete len:119 (+) Transcript_20455:1184-1540(+)
MAYDDSSMINIPTEIKPCTLHVTVFPVAINAGESFGTIQVDRKHSQKAMNRFATVIWATTSVVSGTFCHFLPTSRNTRHDPTIENDPPTLGRMANAFKAADTDTMVVEAVTTAVEDRC